MVTRIHVSGKHRRAGFWALLLILGLAAGCGMMATRSSFYDEIIAELRRDNYEAAVAGIRKAREDNKYNKKDRLLYYLDIGLASHYAAVYDSSNVQLTRAEEAADELFTRSISKAALSVLLNDNALDYSGEDYEILYSNIFKALNYIALDRFDEAFVEVRRAMNKMNLLEQKYNEAARMLREGAKRDTAGVNLEYRIDPVRFNNSALARYLSMHLYAVEGKMDDARIARDLLGAAFVEQPHIYDFPVPEVKYYSADKAIVSFIGLAGLSPVKEAMDLRLRTDKDLDLIQIFYTDPEGRNTEYGHIPFEIDEDFYFKFSIPQIVSRHSIIGGIDVYIDSVYAGRLQLIENVGAIARETFNAKKSLIYFRTIARAIVKGLSTHKLKQKADDGGVGGWLKKAAIDVATDITENADLRCSRLLPGRIYVGDFEVEPGVHDIRFEFLDETGLPVSTTTIDDYPVLERGLNLVEAFSLN